MIASRRTGWNFGLDRAVEHAVALGKPLVVLEALRVDYPWASDRLHAWVIDGMRDNQRALAAAGVTYHPCLERHAGDHRGLLAALAANAAVVVTDDFPCFFLPRMVRAAAHALDVRLETVDANGLLPLRALTPVYPTAYAFRRAWQRVLPAHLADRPTPNPIDGAAFPRGHTLPQTITSRWPDALHWLDDEGSLSRLPIDHSVPATEMRGGSIAARARLHAFLNDDVASYGTGRHQPDHDVASRLSPYLHWGHLSTHEVFDALMRREGWLGAMPAKATGSREGWWGVSPSADAFLDELVTWRELGYNMTSTRDDYDRYESLPAWAQTTLDAHATDRREWLYDIDAFDRAATHDPLWNAAQRQLTSEGRIHNYLRMLWGKRILEWTTSPREALAIMTALNNRYALDGRNPNSSSGIFWVLGRYDRPWFPERDIFGTVRYMSSKNTARKLRVKDYIRRYGDGLF